MAGYRVGSYLGGGGFADVWAGLRYSDGSAVAIKLGLAATAEAGRRFALEAGALKSVDPAFVPQLYEGGTLADGRPYLVMERLRGTLLSDTLGRLEGPPSLAWIRHTADALLRSLAALHAAELVHCDLKPENVFCVEAESSGDTSTVLKLLDLGTARSIFSSRGSVEESLLPATEREDSQSDGPSSVVGSVEYMTPEQLAGTELDVRTDIYSFGVMLYEFMTLRVPFNGPSGTIKHGHESLRPTRPSVYAEVPEALEKLCLACLAKDPNKRPESTTALRDMLARACRGTTGQGSSSIRRARTAPLLTDSRQPVVLFVVDVPETSPAAVALAVERRKAVIARREGNRYLCGFSVLDDEEPAQAALSLARQLVQSYGARVALHLAQLKVRRRRKRLGAALYGRPLDDTDSWLPRGDWDGILLTEKIASVLPEEQTTACETWPGFFRLVPDELPTLGFEPDLESSKISHPVPSSSSEAVPLVGRESLLALAQASFRDVLDEGNPGLFTVYGDSGMGKSRLVHTIATLASRWCHEAEIISIRATRRILGGTDLALDILQAQLSALLAARGRDQSVQAIGDAIRHAAATEPLVLIFDDAHYAVGGLLDAIEYATLDGDGIRLWVVVAAQNNLRRRRPQWGERAHRHSVVDIEPLGEAASMELAARLLQPAEYPPADVLRRLARWTAGSPHSLTELVRTLKREGIVRQRAQGRSWYVATAELDRLPPSPAEQWLAARRLDAMPAELAACLRLCSVLGLEFLRDELEWVQNAADYSGTAGSSMDTDVGLLELARLESLEGGDGGVWSFREAALQDAIYKLVGSRERKLIHRDALEFWREKSASDSSDRVLIALARHAGPAGASDMAADAYLVLADRALASHLYVDADHYYTSALSYIESDNHALEVRALGGRGRVRYRIQRIRESRSDLQTAQDHARALGDRALLIDLILEEATALDWAWMMEDAAQRVEAAGELVRESDHAKIRCRYYNALARSHYRQERMQEAVDLYNQAIDLAVECGDDETLTIALLLLALALFGTGDFVRARQRSDQVIELCQRTGDRLHLCAAYCNRVIVNSTEKSVTGTVEDLRRAVKLAREIGQPILERIATHNLAEFLHWSGKHDEALTLALRAYDLQRFLPERAAADALLLARICAALDDVDGLRRMRTEIQTLAQAKQLTQFESSALDMLDLLMSDDPSSREWDRLIESAHSNLPSEEFLEFLFFRARAAIKQGDWSCVHNVLTEARPRLDEHPAWRAPFAEIAAIGREHSLDGQ